MKLEEIQRLLEGILSAKILQIGDGVLRVGTVLTAVLILFGTYVFARVLNRGIRRGLVSRGSDEGTIRAITRLLHYLLFLVGAGVALDTVGIDLNALFAAGAVFAVGIGFAMKNIVENFVAGVILLVERAIKPSDILEVEGRVVRVTKMGIRATIVRTRDDEDLIVPNGTLVQSSVKNFTYSDSLYRLRLLVGVVYGSEMRRVRATLESVGEALEWRSRERPPRVLLRAFGSSSVDWELSVWIADPWQSQTQLSMMHEAVWDAFEEAGLVIAFPQLDLHLDPPIADALTAMSKAA